MIEGLILVALSMVITLGVYYLVIPKSRIRKINEDLKNLKTKRSSLKNSIHIAVQNKEKAEEEFLKFENLVLLLKDELEDLITQKQSVLEDLEDFKEKITYAGYRLTKNEQLLDSTKSEITELNKTKTLLSKEVELLNSQFSLIYSENTRLQSTKVILENEVSILSKSKETILEKSPSISKSLPSPGDRIFEKIEYLDPVRSIGYTPNTNFTNTSYPYVSMPKSGSLVQFPRKGRMGRKGIKEIEFEMTIRKYFQNLSFIFSSENYLYLADKSKTFEPDLAFIDTANSVYIDIEIDEPYEGLGKTPIHFIGQDDIRNNYFNERGWIVIRFTELQVHSNIKGCCRLIAEVIKSIDLNFSIPQELENISIVSSEPFWTKEQAENWAKIKYRENYLGIDSFEQRSEQAYILEGIVQNENEKAVELSIKKAFETSKKLKGDNKLKPKSRIGRFGETNFSYIDYEFIESKDGIHLFKFHNKEGEEVFRTSKDGWHDYNFEPHDILLVDAGKTIRTLMEKNLLPMGLGFYEWDFPLGGGTVFLNKQGTICIEGWSENKFIDHQISRHKYRKTQNRLRELLENPEFQSYDKTTLQNNGIEFEELRLEYHVKTAQYILQLYKHQKIIHIATIGLENTPTQIKLVDANKTIDEIIKGVVFHTSSVYFLDKGGIFYQSYSGELGIKGWGEEEFLANQYERKSLGV